MTTFDDLYDTDTAMVCDCCALMIAGNDDSSCRSYHGHTHPTLNLCALTVENLGDTNDNPWPVNCQGCGQELMPMAHMWRSTIAVPPGWRFSDDD